MEEIGSFEIPAYVDKAFALLEKSGFEAYLVGGAVRDFARGRSTGTDWDMTTNALPEQVKCVFSGYHLIETGMKHGTVTVMIDHEPIEITTYRLDGAYSDNRHPDAVSFTRNLKDDLVRRDFTMNALAYNPRYGIIDLVGGRADIADGVIRCVGDPDRRFSEDALRMLRALRFSAVLGFAIEGETARAIHVNKHLLKSIAPERIENELTRMLCGANVENILGEFSDVLAELIPEIIPMFGFEQRNSHHDRDVWTHTIAVTASIPGSDVLRWSALLHDIGKPECFALGKDGEGHFYGHAGKSMEMAEEILGHLRFDNARKERIMRLIRYHDFPIEVDEKRIKRLMNKHGVDVVRQLIELHKADTLGQAAICIGRIAEYDAVGKVVDEILAKEACFSLRDLKINGNDLKMIGLGGKQIGAALQACLEAVMDERIPNERDSLLDFAAQQRLGED